MKTEEDIKYTINDYELAKFTAEAKRLQELKQELEKETDAKVMAKARMYDYQRVLEEINRALLGVRGLSINCDKQIIKVKTIVNEVLK